jgi:glucan phosphoethanolaminetransferase (alkaline phosphatase superfamily)
VDSALRNALAILVSELFQQLIILHQERFARTGGDEVLVVGDRIAPVVVMISIFLAINLLSFWPIRTHLELLLKYYFPLDTIGVAYGNAPASIRCGGGADGKLLASSRALPCLATVVEPADSEARR